MYLSNRAVFQLSETRSVSEINEKLRRVSSVESHFPRKLSDAAPPYNLRIAALVIVFNCPKSPARTRGIRDSFSARSFRMKLL